MKIWILVLIVAVVISITYCCAKRQKLKRILALTNRFTDPCGCATALKDYRRIHMWSHFFGLFPAQYGFHNLHEVHDLAIESLTRHIFGLNSALTELRKSIENRLLEKPPKTVQDLFPLCAETQQFQNLAAALYLRQTELLILVGSGPDRGISHILTPTGEVVQ